jgi:hypothetical protein
MVEDKIPGEEKAWDILATLEPEDVCKAASVDYDATHSRYTVTSFGKDFMVSLKDRTVSSTSQGSDVLLGRHGPFFRLSLLWYLVNARNIACTGRLVKLEHIRGGDIFTIGSHRLPLDAAAKKYGRDKNGFIERGGKLGGRIDQYGDVSIRLYPLPRIPVIFVLWLDDEEFPARADLLFDSTCEMQLPTDIIWSIALVSVLLLL